MNPQPTLIEEDCISDSGSPTSRRGSLVTEQLCERLEMTAFQLESAICGSDETHEVYPDLTLEIEPVRKAASTLRALTARVEALEQRLLALGGSVE